MAAAMLEAQAGSPAAFVLISAILSTIVLVTFVGNLFVIVAIKVDKNLQTTANQLVLSLASADLMVACLVMPLGAYNDLGQGWRLGTRICEFWTSADVLCCTASILNLLAIAIDRYWAVTNADYIYRRTRRRVNLMILCAWTVGAVVSLAPIFGWKDPDFQYRVLVEHKCLVSQDVGYQIFATLSTFYLPLVLLLALYWRIFQVARKRIHRRPGARIAAPQSEPRRLQTATNSVSPDRLGAGQPHPSLTIQTQLSLKADELGRQKVDHPDKNDELTGSDAAAAGRSPAPLLGQRRRVRPSEARVEPPPPPPPPPPDEDCCCCRAAATCQVCRQAAGEINRADLGNQPDIGRRSSRPRTPPVAASDDSSVATSSTSGANYKQPMDDLLAWPQISVDIDDANADENEEEEELDDEESLSSAFPPPLVTRDGSLIKPNQLQLKLVAALHPSTSSGPPDAIETGPAMSPKDRAKRPSRSLDLRRKFKALGQLVSFVQTSAPDQYASSSGSSSSASSPLSMSLHTNRQPTDGPSDLSLAQLGPGSCNGQQPMATTTSSTSAPVTCTTPDATTAVALNSSASDPTGAGSGPGSRGVANLKKPTTAPSAKTQQEMRREKKAAKTLVIITGVFVCCWLPFFLNAIIMPICGPSCTPSDLVLSILLWLGYLNSLLNPIIYTIFSPDFRRAFRRLLCWSGGGRRERRPSVAKRS